MSVEALSQLIDEHRGSFPPDLCVAVTDPATSTDALFPIEAAAVARAVPSRQSEFAAGRLAGRTALAEFGLPDRPIPMAEDRAPVWPRGITGSISHNETACIAAVAPQMTTRALGIDIETDAPLDRALLDEISDKREREAFEDDEELAARRIFSAKEAAYKAQYPLTRTVFGFDHLKVMAATPQGVALVFMHDVLPFAKNDVITARQWRGHGFILSLSVLHKAD